MQSSSEHRVLVLSVRAEQYLERLAAARLPGLTVLTPDDPAHYALCDIVFGEPQLLPPLLPRLTAAQWVQATWAGVEPLVVPGLRRDYVLTNARGVFGALMIEYVFGYLLAHVRHIVQRVETQKAGVWDKTPPGTLRGKRLGLMGVGSIGAELARAAKQFGMRVSGYTRASEECADVDTYYHGAARLRFASELDYLVCCLPNVSATQHLVDADLLAALPSHALFVNVGRGNAVDEDALVAALYAGQLAGAVLDVFAVEPLPADHALWHAPGVRITSHTAALSDAQEMVDLFADNYARWIGGMPLKYRVDFERGY